MTIGRLYLRAGRSTMPRTAFAVIGAAGLTLSLPRPRVAALGRVWGLSLMGATVWVGWLTGEVTV